MKLRMIVAAAVLPLLIGGCAEGSGGSGDASPTPSQGASPAPDDADRVLLRVDSEGGFVAPEYTFGSIPAFSLFADGTLITPGPQIEIYPGPALPAIQTQAITPEGVQAILQAANDAGVNTAEDMTDFGSVGIADATTTVITLATDGSTHTVRVYALGELSDRPPGMSAQEFQARTKLQSLVEDLSRLDAWLPAGAIGEAEPYAAQEASLWVSDYRPDPQLHQVPVAWPLPTPLEGIGKATTPSGYRCTVVRGQDWTQILQPDAARANQLTPWTSGGASFAIVFRPLLPDEHSC